MDYECLLKSLADLDFTLAEDLTRDRAALLKERLNLALEFKSNTCTKTKTLLATIAVVLQIFFLETKMAADWPQMILVGVFCWQLFGPRKGLTRTEVLFRIATDMITVQNYAAHQQLELANALAAVRMLIIMTLCAIHSPRAKVEEICALGFIIEPLAELARGSFTISSLTLLPFRLLPFMAVYIMTKGVLGAMAAFYVSAQNEIE